MENSIIQDFIQSCMNNDLKKAKELYDENSQIIDINSITHDTNTSSTQGPYNIFECMCIVNNMSIVTWFIEMDILPKHYNDGFISACQYNHLELVQYLYDHRKNINLDFQTSFIICCSIGNLELLKWLYVNTHTEIDIHIHDDTPFLYAIAEGHFDIARWLYHISIADKKLVNIHADNNYAFLIACHLGRLDICQWLYLVSNNTIDKHMQDDAPLKCAKLSDNQELIRWLEI